MYDLLTNDDQPMMLVCMIVAVNDVWTLRPCVHGQLAFRHFRCAHKVRGIRLASATSPVALVSAVVTSGHNSRTNDVPSVKCAQD